MTLPAKKRKLNYMVIKNHGKKRKLIYNTKSLKNHGNSTLRWSYVCSNEFRKNRLPKANNPSMVKFKMAIRKSVDTLFMSIHWEKPFIAANRISNRMCLRKKVTVRVEYPLF